MSSGIGRINKVFLLCKPAYYSGPNRYPLNIDSGTVTVTHVDVFFVVFVATAVDKSTERDNMFNRFTPQTQTFCILLGTCLSLCLLNERFMNLYGFCLRTNVISSTQYILISKIYNKYILYHCYVFL